MKSQRKQVESMIKQLYDIHEQLFGRKYTIGTQINDESEFNKIVEEFRELIFQIRHTQQEREEREKKKNFHQSSQAIQLNYLIREDIQRAQAILTEAATRLQADRKKVAKKLKAAKKEDASKDQKVTGVQLLKKKQTIIENCFELLKDVKEIEQGGVYQPPQSYQTLNDIRKQLIGRQYETVEENSINIEEQEFFEEANKKDQIMDGQLDQIIEGNQRVKDKMKAANQSMDHIHERVIKVTKKTEALTERIKKDDKDLLDLLKTYRRPNQLCLDITLVLMVLALIGVIINLVRTL